MKLEISKWFKTPWINTKQEVNNLAHAIGCDLRKIADEVEGLKAHIHHENVDLDGTSTPVYPDPSCDINEPCASDEPCKIPGGPFSNCTRPISTPSDTCEAPAEWAPSCTTCSNKRCMEGKKPLCRPGDTEAFIPKDPAGCGPEDLRWQLANENVALMAKVDELQEAVEEAGKCFAEMRKRDGATPGVKLAAAYWRKDYGHLLKKHGGEG